MIRRIIIFTFFTCIKRYKYSARWEVYCRSIHRVVGKAEIRNSGGLFGLLLAAKCKVTSEAPLFEFCLKFII